MADAPPAIPTTIKITKRNSTRVKSAEMNAMSVHPPAARPRIQICQTEANLA